MQDKETYSKHYEESAVVNADPQIIFAFADNHKNFSSHMDKSSWMMGGGSMNTHIDDKKFQVVGSHIQMNGNVLGIKLFLDEAVTQHEPPFHKEWQTTGNLNLVVIDHYKLGFNIKPENGSFGFTVYI